MAIDGRDLHLPNVLHLSTDGDMLVTGFRGMGKGGDSKTSGPHEAHPSAGIPVNRSVSKTKKSLQAEGLKISFGLVNPGMSV